MGKGEKERSRVGLARIVTTVVKQMQLARFNVSIMHLFNFYKTGLKCQLKSNRTLQINFNELKYFKSGQSLSYIYEYLNPTVNRQTT